MISSLVNLMVGKRNREKKQRAELKVLAGPKYQHWSLEKRSFAGTGQANLQGMLEWAPELEHATRNQTQQPCSEPSRGRTQPPKIDGDLFYDTRQYTATHRPGIWRHRGDILCKQHYPDMFILYGQKRYSQWSIIRPLLVIISCMSGCLFLSVHATVR